MRKIFYFIILLSLIMVGCSKENTSLDDSPVVKVKTLIKVTPQKAKIGDTITIEGENLDKIFLMFNDTRDIKIISVQSNKIVAIVPTLYNENVTIKSMVNVAYVNDSITFKLVGVFPIKHSLELGDIIHIKAVSEKIFFATSGSQLYKTTDGGYNWDLVKDFNTSVGSIYFLDENKGWVSAGTSEAYLYYTNDGGKTFQPIFKSGTGYDGKYITGMYFSNPTNGYLLTGKGEIYVTNDNTKFNLVYTDPESDKDSGSIEFDCLSVYNNTVMATGTLDFVPVLIKGQNSIFSSSILSSDGVQKVQLMNDQEAYLVHGAKLYYSNSSGNTWEKVGDMKLYNIYFMDKNNGIGISSDIGFTHNIILNTKDGGISWQTSLELLDFEYTKDMAFSGNVGLFSGYRNHLWKYIKE